MHDQDQTPHAAREESARELPEITWGRGRRVDRSATGHRAGGTVSPALALGTAAVTAILAAILAADAIQHALFLSWTAIDLTSYAGSPQTSLAVNAVQTLAVLALVVLALVLGTLCVGRRQGAVRVGGGLAVLAVCLLGTTLLGMPVLNYLVSMLFTGRLPGLDAADTTVLVRLLTALPVGLPALVACFAAALLLLSAWSSRRRETSDRRTLMVAVMMMAPMLLLSVLVVARSLNSFRYDASWWGIYGMGMRPPFTPVGTTILMGFLVGSLLLAALAAGLLLGSRDRAALVAGGALLAAVALPLIVQIGAWGMTSVFMRAIMMGTHFETVAVVDSVLGVSVFTLMLIAVIGAAIALRRAAVTRGRGGPSTRAGR